MTDKATRTNTIFNEILENIRYTHDKKNDDYKDSYSDTMKRFGTKSGLVRIYDKFNRIAVLVGAVDYFAFVLFKLQKVIINPKSGYWVVLQKNRLAGSGKELVANRKRNVIALIYK